MTRKRRAVAVLVPVAVFAAHLTLAQDVLYRVDRVVDGDTVILEGIGRVRLIGVDAPETVDPGRPVQPFGVEASAFLTAVLKEKSVRVEFDQMRMDRYGRTLAYLYLSDGTFVNLEIVKQGYGRVYTEHPFKYVDDFRFAEREARDTGRGLWAPFNAPATGEAGGRVVINEFRTRGPRGGNDEFVELKNTSSSPVDVGRWQVQGSNARGSVSTRSVLPYGTFLFPGCHFLLGNSSRNGYQGPVDASYGVGIADNGGVALIHADGTIVDAVGLSEGSSFREGSPLPSFGRSNTDRSWVRQGRDTGDNSADFSMTTDPTPTSSKGSCEPNTVEREENRRPMDRSET